MAPPGPAKATDDLDCPLTLSGFPVLEGVDENVSIQKILEGTAYLRTLAEVSGMVFVDLVPVDRVDPGEAVRRRRALGPLEEALQGLLGMRADEPLPLLRRARSRRASASRAWPPRPRDPSP